MAHRNAPLTEKGISRACVSDWVNRWRRHGDFGLLDRPSAPADHYNSAVGRRRHAQSMPSFRSASSWSCVSLPFLDCPLWQEMIEARGLAARCQAPELHG